jgi:glutaredoxin 3
MSTVTIYTTSNCPYCVAAKALLKNKGVSFNEISVEDDRVAASTMVKRTGRRSVPQIFVGATHVGGCDDLKALEEGGHLDALLERA